ncbi:type VI secretion system needle protein Hcp [Labilibaculum sp. DW002]|uniref:Type VI secretion system needle protein Hcp n=1 Tax=Paralabilibaculum antarcticum TaxID=2912572 RepID=A0ABT5VUT6_9BACT|nr:MULTISPECIES: type VI secretion system tube protein TssD [unclassified Labilibaculum]MBI9060196.1 type VI secretion system needle protein Hcp [Labilibaculum sp.]MDE5419185.1 type VI secretion system needle protein Hcp [Labilibaculum sp. DW002]
MSFKAKLNVGGKTMNVLSCNYDLTQEVDATGRPSSVTRGGRVMLTVESTGDTDMFEWMCNNFERKDGTVTFLKRDTDAKQKELSFTEGYLVKYEEKFNAFDNMAMAESFTISAREIKMGNGEHVNEWV